MTPEGTAFAPRSPVTLGHYDKAGERYGKKPLWRHGDLYGKIHMQAEMDAATIGSNAIQAAMMQFGGRKAEHPNLWGDIPARPFIGLSDEDRGDVLENIDEWLQRATGSRSVAAEFATSPGLSSAIGCSHLIPQKARLKPFDTMAQRF